MGGRAPGGGGAEGRTVSYAATNPAPSTEVRRGRGCLLFIYCLQGREWGLQARRERMQGAGQGGGVGRERAGESMQHPTRGRTAGVEGADGASAKSSFKRHSGKGREAQRPQGWARAAQAVAPAQLPQAGRPGPQTQLQHRRTHLPGALGHADHAVPCTVVSQLRQLASVQQQPGNYAHALRRLEADPRLQRGHELGTGAHCHLIPVHKHTHPPAHYCNSALCTHPSPP